MDKQQTFPCETCRFKARYMDTRPFGTCFFEQYAQITLATLLGTEFASLVNRDRPDLQSPDGVSVGIEVTRAMEEGKAFYLEAIRRQNEPVQL